MTKNPVACNALRMLAVLMFVCLLPTTVRAARKSPAPDNHGVVQGLSIRVGDRVVAALMHDTPDVYVSGIIGSDAPSRFLAMMKSGQIPAGSNVYLNSPGGDLAAGLALGRLFRIGTMTTFIGRPPFASESGSKTLDGPVMCASACAYAYLGGMWRSAPTAGAPLGVHQFYFPNTTTADVGEIEKASGAIVAYLHEMGINPEVFSLASTVTPDNVVWLDGSEMLRLGLANNGVAPIHADYKLLVGLPYLTLDQVSRDGEHKIVILCAPADVSLMAIYVVGQNRAQQIVERGIKSYFSIDGKDAFAAGTGSFRVINDSVAFDRHAPKSFLHLLAKSRSVGAWIDDQNGAFRTGFTMNLDPVRSKVENYYENCVSSTAAGAQ